MKFLTDILARASLTVEGVVTLNNTASATVNTNKFVVLDSSVVKIRTAAQVLSDIGAQAALTNPVTGTGTSGQVAYFNGTTSLTSDATFTYSPTSAHLINNSVTAASAIARGTNLTPTLTAAANNDVLVGLDINPTFTNGAFTGVTNLALRATGNANISGTLNGVTQYVTIGGSHYLELISSSSTSAYVNFRRGAGSNGTYAYNLNNGAGYFSNNNITGETSLFAGAGGFFLNFYSGGTEAMRIFGSTRNVVIQNGGTYTDAGYKLDVNGTARVQGVITGYVNGGSLILGAASANTPAITITGYYVGNGAISTSNSNARSFNTIIGAQNNGISVYYNGNAQGQTIVNTYFTALGNINLTDGAIDLNGFNFSPTIVSETGATIKAFSSSLSVASNHWNLYMSGTAANYLAGQVGIGTTSINASAKVQIDSTIQGFLPPRMTTTQKNAISSPATGLVVYDSTLNNIVYYNGTAWTTQQDVITLTTTGSSGSATFTNNTLNIPTYTIAGLGGIAASRYIVDEIPSGTVNGVNTTFTLANTPVTGKQMVFVNGIKMEVGASSDYTMSGPNIIFNSGAIPDVLPTVDKISVTYIY